MVSRLERARQALTSVVDPEIPALSIEDMGILRATTETATGVKVTITPTYSGCPAMGQIESDIRSALATADVGEVEIETVYSPAWTTDWMNEEARRKLEASGIAPPTSNPRCPRCLATEPRTVSEFGSTACKALLVCSACGEPFHYFKEI
ncbi:MAG: phenylacetate-CoA oxygenase subunit PaaJ [Acidimicrobiia bacterium]|nr:phenylacetate-CoA oxygenase subunit PaaJ [Acidimicrobiia bacterium]MDH4309641.1 phenylacetate-CoA oxygenase subunit PaaJ [Acidimicrobiia bacterium]